MLLKVFAAVMAVALVVAYLIPPIYKLQDVELIVVVLIGMVMMMVDLWQSLQKDD
jgi:hypothetical protein